jgi:predicted PurR-regulated permease PerM
METLTTSVSASRVRPAQVALGVLAVAAILGLLYLGRPILVPVTLAVVLSFAIGPLVRVSRQLGLGHVSSVLGAVAATGLVVLMLATVIGTQAVQMASNLPAYQETFRANVRELRTAALARLEPTWKAAERMLDPLEGEGAESGGKEELRSPPLATAPTSVIPVEIRQPKATPTQWLQRLLALVWGPLGSAGIVVVVLIFVLLEREALRDRFIRLAGGSDLRATTTAINDAGERLSRYLVRQFAVNAGVGVVIWTALTAIGLPHATLVASLTAVLRFVPFLGVPIAAVLAALLALATAPGWTMLGLTLTVFVVVQLITSQVIEPRLYGHATGLSPLSIVLATLFWGWLWGPIGVIIATPLTLCLAVAGRHAESLGFLDIVLGDAPALTMAQKFYQRALSADAEEIISDAREFLKRRPLAAYCDTVLMPALQLGRGDLAAGDITPHQQLELRNAIVRVVEALDGSARAPLFGRRHATVLEDASAGRLLRQKRLLRQRSEAARASPDAKARAAPGSLVLCVGLGTLGDDLATELLVRILRELHVDARHLTVEDLHAPPPPEVALTAIGAVCIVSFTPGEEREKGGHLAQEIRSKLPHAYLLALLPPSVLAEVDQSTLGDNVDRIASTFEDAALEVSERLAGIGFQPANAGALSADSRKPVDPTHDGR